MSEVIRRKGGWGWNRGTCGKGFHAGGRRPVLGHAARSESSDGLA